MHAFRLTWSNTLGNDPGTAAPTAAPILPGDVALRVETLNGAASAAVTPVAGAPGRYAIDLPVEARAGYRLTGRIGGRDISAEVRLPGPLEVRLPVGDTVFTTAGPLFRREPYAWRASGAGGYVLYLGVGALDPARGDTTGSILFFAGLGDTVTVDVLALDSTSAQYFRAGFNAPRQGNITGGLGTLAGATTARRVFIWR